MKVLVNAHISTLVLIALLLPATMPAQDATTPAKSENAPPKESSNTGVYGREVYSPDTQARSEPEKAATSFADGFLTNTRQHFGVSVGVAETYTPNVLTSSLSPGSTDLTQNKGVSLTSIFPQIYTNFQKKHFAFRLTYGASYNRYNGALSQLNRLSQNGTATFAYTLVHRKTTLQLTDSLFSRYYDPGSLLGASLGSVYLSGTGASQLYLESRRESRNLADLSLSYYATKKSSIGITLDDDIARYTGTDIPRSNRLSAGVGVAYQVKKWLSLDTHYYHYLNNVDPRYRGNNIENLQIAGLSFKPKRGWVVSGSGGIQSTKTGGIRYVTGSAQGSVSKSSAHTTIGISYGRGYLTVFPTAQIWKADTVNLYMIQALSRQLSLHANGSYIRGSVLINDASLNTGYGNGGLDFALQKNLVLSANYSFVSQKLENLVLSGTNVRRSTVSVSMNYYLPGVHPEGRR